MAGVARNTEKPNAGAGGAGPAGALVQADALVDNGMFRVCCGNLIRPRMAELSEAYGRTLFVVVWRCPTCGHVDL